MTTPYVTFFILPIILHVLLSKKNMYVNRATIVKYEKTIHKE